MTRRTVTIEFDDLQLGLQDQHVAWSIDPATGRLCLEPEEAEMHFGDDMADTWAPVNPDDVLELPSFDSSDGFRLMEQFALALENRQAAEALLEALGRRKPFRQFKDALADFPEIESDWFGFQAEQLRQLAEEHYEDLGIQVLWKAD